MPTFMATPPIGARMARTLRHGVEEPLVTGTEFPHAEVMAGQGDLILAADAVARRRVGQLRQVLDDPSAAKPSPPLDALQVDQPDVELAGGELADQEVAAVQVAVVVAGLVQARTISATASTIRRSSVWHCLSAADRGGNRPRRKACNSW